MCDILCAYDIIQNGTENTDVRRKTLNEGHPEDHSTPKIMNCVLRTQLHNEAFCSEYSRVFIVIGKTHFFYVKDQYLQEVLSVIKPASQGPISLRGKRTR